MKTKAVRMYGKEDLRLEEFELPAIKDDEILAHVISDSICMSTYKAAIEGTDHKRVPNDIAENPVMVGHEFCGEIIQVGAKWADQFHAGDKFSIQPAINYKGSLASPGYSYPFIGGSATYIVIPNEVMEMNCLLPYDNDVFYYGSLAEPVSCCIGGFHAQYHTTPGSYVHKMDIKDGGYLGMFAAAGPMGLGAIDYAIHGPHKPSVIVVTDIDDARLSRAAEVLTVEDAERNGVKLAFVNTAKMADPIAEIMELTDGHGFDDLFVFAPVRSVLEMADKLLARDGCLNFFAGPIDSSFSAMFNFYNVHYASTHIVGTSGGNTDDMREALSLMNTGKMNPSMMITHIGGLNAVVNTVLNLPKIPGGKKLIYTNIDLPLTALSDLNTSEDPMLQELGKIVHDHNGLWCAEAEHYLLAHAKAI